MKDARTDGVGPDDAHEEEAERKVEDAQRQVDAHGGPAVLLGELLEALAQRELLLRLLAVGVPPPRREPEAAALRRPLAHASETERRSRCTLACCPGSQQRRGSCALPLRVSRHRLCALRAEEASPGGVSRGCRNRSSDAPQQRDGPQAEHRL